MLSDADFKQLLSDNHNRITAIAKSYAGADQWQDLYQEIALQIWRSRGAFKGESSINTWVYRIAINTALTFRKSVMKLRNVYGDDGIPQSQERICHGALEVKKLYDFMNSLNPIDKGVLMMYLDGIGNTEIADTFGISTNAVYIRTNRLKAKFTDMFID